ncbi:MULTISPECIES: ParB/RepB/Spo0J family partition protein [Sphingomonadaceae]|uniref:Chromosome partitioning protein, ParB family n=1 Tax=Novosphingobium panipatense TaxID=428991 RepID=A0ABY1QU47_9SPHN|nr:MULTISPECIES: ParB/RepB/Spo0J family partition protein [Sphingomonadaceae]SMP80903.1 chromosome partitioning protein, ParB family [Novosphingobium panipatense]
MSSFRERAAQISGVLHARTAEAAVQELALDDVIPDPENPRRDFDEEELAKLAKSIERRGVLQPITVRPADKDGKFVIRFGERRWRASKIAGKPTIRAIVSETASETDNLVEQVIENEQRADLRTSEMVEAVQRLLQKGWSKTAIAEELSCKPAEITQFAAVPEMADYLRELIDVWPRRALYDLHIASRKHSDAIKRFVASRREQGVTTAAVAGFVRGLKDPQPPKAVAPVETPAPPSFETASEEHGGPDPAESDSVPASVRGKGRRKAVAPAAPVAPIVTVIVGGRNGRLILPDTVSVLFEGADGPVTVAASEVRLIGAAS